MVLNALKIFPFFPLLWVVSKSINWRAISRKKNWVNSLVEIDYQGIVYERYYWYMEILLRIHSNILFLFGLINHLYKCKLYTCG